MQILQHTVSEGSDSAVPSAVSEVSHIGMASVPIARPPAHSCAVRLEQFVVPAAVRGQELAQ